MHVNCSVRSTLLSPRNGCRISNIRPEGLTYERADFKLAWLIEMAYERGVSGTAQKDKSDDPSQYHILKPRGTTGITSD